MPSGTPDIRKSAVWYARKNWLVFPVRTLSKTPLTPHGFQDASKDKSQIEEWWATWPDANIGLACALSGVVAIDGDPNHYTAESRLFIDDLVANHPTAIQITPTDGIHLLYEMPPDMTLSNSNKNLPPGVDIRSQGYILLTPSIVTYRGEDARTKGVEDGFTGHYRWDPPPHKYPPQPLPEHVLALLTCPPKGIPFGPPPAPMTIVAPERTSRYAEAALLSELDRLTIAPEGTRNDQLNRSAFSLGQLVAGGALDEGEVRQRLEDTALAIRLGDREAQRTVDSGLSAGMKQSRSVPEETKLIFRNDNISAQDLEASISIVGDSQDAPPLPEYASIDPDIATGAASWLDAYIEHSRRWSPRAHDDFHEATGLWILSTVAARRVRLDLGGERYTNLAIALAARTSIFAKTTTAKVGMDLLKDANLSFILAPDDATPQAFIRNMAARLPSSWPEMSREQQIQVEERLAFAGQKGWYFDEFGQKVSAMMREGGFMADFRGLLRKFDDTPAIYEYVSVSRGSDIVKAPYLALLANLTPTDLIPFAKRGAALWGDGFWARFAFITPPPNTARKKGRFPSGERVTPDELVTKIKWWHTRLGVPDVQIVEQFGSDNKATGKFDLSIVPAPIRHCSLGEGVYEAFYRYHDALLDIVEQSSNHDLDGNYSRMAEKALRVAMLLGSIENHEQVEIRHWARAQQITESWRRNLHYLYNETTGSGQSRGEEIEEKIMRLIAGNGPLTKREIYHYVRGIDSGSAGIILQNMVSAELLVMEKEGRAERYKLAG